MPLLGEVLFPIHGSTHSLAAPVVFSILSHIQGQQTGRCWLHPLQKSEAHENYWLGWMITSCLSAFTVVLKEDLTGVEANRKTAALWRVDQHCRFLLIITIVVARVKEKLRWRGTTQRHITVFKEDLFALREHGLLIPGSIQVQGAWKNLVLWKVSLLTAEAWSWVFFPFQSKPVCASMIMLQGF